MIRQIKIGYLEVVKTSLELLKNILALKNRKNIQKIYKNFKTFYSIYKSVLKRACILCKKKQEITLYQWGECVTKLRGETTQYQGTQMHPINFFK